MYTVERCDGCSDYVGGPLIAVHLDGVQVHTYCPDNPENRRACQCLADSYNRKAERERQIHVSHSVNPDVYRLSESEIESALEDVE